jgi:hypothetical protein
LLLSSDFIKNSVLAFNKLSLSAGYALTIFSSLSYASNEVIKIYQTDRNYPRFYNNFLRNSDNGRSSLRITNTFSLEVTSISCGWLYFGVIFF